MKFSFLLLLMFTISCKPKINHNDLVGTWTSEINPPSELKVLDKLIFLPNDSVKIEMYLNDVLEEKYSGKYVIEDGGILMLHLDTAKTRSKILFLDKDKLILEGTNPKAKWRLKRLITINH